MKTLTFRRKSENKEETVRDVITENFSGTEG